MPAFYDETEQADLEAADLDAVEPDEQEQELGEADDSTTEVEEDFRIEVPVDLGEFGGERVVELGREELREATQKSLLFDRVVARGRQLQEELQQANRIANYVAQDPLATQLLLMRQQGLNDRQIAERLLSIAGPGDSAPEDLPDIDPDLAKVISAREQKLLEQIKAQSQKFDQFQSEAERREVAAYNNEVFGRAINSLGVEYDQSEAHAQRVRDAVVELYGTVPPNHRFTEAQARAVLQLANLPKREQKQAPAKGQNQAKAIAGAKKAPRVISGARSKGAAPAPQQKKKFVDSYTRGDAYASWGLD